MNTQLASTQAAEAMHEPKGTVAETTPIYADGKRGRAAGKGATVRDIPTQLSGTNQLDRKRERAPARGVKDSDIPAR